MSEQITDDNILEGPIEIGGRSVEAIFFYYSVLYHTKVPYRQRISKHLRRIYKEPGLPPLYENPMDGVKDPEKVDVKKNAWRRQYPLISVAWVENEKDGNKKKQINNNKL